MSDLHAVIGAGTMGAGIAQVAALAGHQVIIDDVLVRPVRPSPTSAIVSKSWLGEAS